MPILHETKDCFRFASVLLARTGAFVNLDRRTDHADVFSLAFVVPFRRKAARLTEITSVQVSKREHDDGPSTYSTVLRLRHGDNIKFACGSRDEALDLMRKLSKFLKLA
jgi:hypothetical protein